MRKLSSKEKRLYQLKLQERRFFNSLKLINVKKVKINKKVKKVKINKEIKIPNKQKKLLLIKKKILLSKKKKILLSKKKKILLSKKKKILLSKKKIIVKQKKKFIKKEKIKDISINRIRKQYNADFRQTPNEDYSSDYGYVGIKAMTINPDITENTLKIAISEIMKDLFIEEKDFSIYSYYASELQKLGSKEETKLDDYMVHVLVYVNRKKPLHFIR